MKKVITTILIVTLFFNIIACSTEAAGDQAQTASTKSDSGDGGLWLVFLFIFFPELFGEPKKQSQCNAQGAAIPVTGAGKETTKDFLADPIQSMVFSEPAKQDWFNTAWGPQLVTYYEHNGAAWITSDMVLPLSDRLAQAPAMDGQPAWTVGEVQTSRRWPDKQVSYCTGNGGDDATFLQAVAHWEEKTAFRFTSSCAGNYINVVGAEEACWSYVGMIGGSQNLNLHSVCGKGPAIHEIGHALGLHHEQNRSDRDTYVDLNFDNMTATGQANFSKATSAVDKGGYDFSSIMHYGSYYFAIDSNTPVMTKKDGSTITPNRSALSDCDISGINELYAN